VQVVDPIGRDDLRAGRTLVDIEDGQVFLSPLWLGLPAPTGAGMVDRWDGSGRPKSRLAILPGLTHYTLFSDPTLAAAVIPFLDETAATGR
jgi:hypothetical protein